MNILFLGDVVGKYGRRAVADRILDLKVDLELALCLANGENASGGLGLTAKSARELLHCGLDGLTSGNHIWRHKDIYGYLDEEYRIVRPYNYPSGAPGRGWMTLEAGGGGQVAVINLIGRTFMEQVDCPFRAADEILEKIPDDVRVRIVDFHAEATSEKKALAYYLDGRVSAVLGTHTHVQTNDAEVLPGGTAYLTDLGMCGVEDSILGMDASIIVERFVVGLPKRFQLAKGKASLRGALLDIDPDTGKTRSIAPFVRNPD